MLLYREINDHAAVATYMKPDLCIRSFTSLVFVSNKLLRKLGFI